VGFNPRDRRINGIQFGRSLYTWGFPYTSGDMLAKECGAPLGARGGEPASCVAGIFCGCYGGEKDAHRP
jgi:hypothetical protein